MQGFGKNASRDTELSAHDRLTTAARKSWRRWLRRPASVAST